MFAKIYSLAVGTLPWNPEVFLLMNEREAKRQNTREPLGAHIISFEHVDPMRSCFEVSESKYDLLRFLSQILTHTLKTASHWIDAFNGPNMCATTTY